jgi:hypothetical protein
MALSHSPSLVLPGLSLCLDAANLKSYPGSGTTWTDLSGNGNNGTLVNGVGYNGSNLGSLVFDGVNDYVSLQNSFSFSFDGDFTIESWVYPTTFNSFNNILSTEDLDFKLISGGNLRIYTTAGSNTSATANLNQWNHILVYRRSGIIYGNVNGAEQQLSPPSFTGDGSSAAEIGRKIRSSNEWFVGRIGKLSIYSKALTAQEIQQNFNATKSRYI